MEETIIKTREIYNGRIVNLSVHDVRMQNGRESTREIIQHPGAVAVVAVDKKRNVLLVKQFRLATGKELFEIPAGTLDPGESPAECAERELQEEVGYRPAKLELIGGVYPTPGYSSEFIHLFLATSLIESRLETDADEFVEVKRIPFVKALEMIERGEIVDSKSVAALLRVARRLGM